MKPAGGSGGAQGGAGKGPANDGSRLDVAMVLKRSMEAFGRDIGGVLIAGVALVIIPGLLSRVLAIDHASDNGWGTLVMTLRGVCAMLYVALVSWGVVARLRGRALAPKAFVAEGLRRAQPGLQVALLAGAGVFAGLIIHLFAQHGTLAGWMLDSMLLTAGLIAVCVAMPVVPVAVVERLGPLAAFRRAAALTEGNRNRILVVALLVALTLAPTGVLLAGIAWPTGLGRLAMALFELIAFSLIATVPAVVYAGLRGEA